MENQQIKPLGRIQSLLFRVYIYLKNKFDPRQPTTQEEECVTKICLCLIDYTGTRLTYAPISNKRFIKNDEKGMFIVIDNHVVSLINHVYGYTISIESETLYKQIIEKFDSTLEERRMALEIEMRQNIQHSLQSILEKLM